MLSAVVAARIRMIRRICSPTEKRFMGVKNETALGRVGQLLLVRKSNQLGFESGKHCDSPSPQCVHKGDLKRVLIEIDLDQAH
jgi:hypothetical protein